MYPTADKQVLKERHERFMADLEARLSERLAPEDTQLLREVFSTRQPNIAPRPLVPRSR